jgi:hypothetical protein
MEQRAACMMLRRERDWMTHGVNDVAGANFQPIHVAAVFKDGRLDLHPAGYDPARPPLVTRQIVDGELVWNYAGIIVRMRRIDEQ